MKIVSTITSQVYSVDARWRNRRHTRTAQAHRLWGATRVVGNGERCAPRPRPIRHERHIDRAVGPCRYAAAAIIRLGEFRGGDTAEGDAGDAQGGVAGVGEGRGLGRCSQAHILLAKVETLWGEADSGRRYARARQAERLRAAGSVVGDGK